MRLSSESPEPTANVGDENDQRALGAPPEPASRDAMVISASGVDAAVRDVLKAVSVRIAARGGGRARLADNDLLAKL